MCKARGLRLGVRMSGGKTISGSTSKQLALAGSKDKLLVLVASTVTRLSLAGGPDIFIYRLRKVS